MKAIICLGNPGREYINTRHNVGFKLADYLRQQYESFPEKKEFEALTTKIEIAEKKCLIVKPQTFMNLSGVATSKIKHFYKIESKDLLLIYDDSEIDFGFIRFRKKGSAGTHNGMKSIINDLNSTNIPRLRIGIGPIPEKKEIKDFVLSNFNATEEKNLEIIFKEVESAINYWLDNNIEKAMALTNKKNILLK
ncbi:MAG: aminoacyl-tRNA hydrolase [Rickettsiales bacterium]|mgnify:CR=1 FL=1|nr:aminoacyl-tRNA hydrolase [Rickettsiales bacterium]|tara:strand:+ start:1694 stop:2272 length:579 start_codon:yes stop_codon:yes gene_type:complete